MVSVRRIVVAIVLTLVAHMAVAAAPTGGEVDLVALIDAAGAQYRSHFKVAPAQAVRQMDEMLVQQYLAQGTIAGEKNAYLKTLYHRAAALLLNGYPIAGGTLIGVARSRGDFAKSPAGAGYAAFVDGMLSPTDEDDDVLADYLSRAKKAQAVLNKELRAPLRVVGALWVVGAIYDDPIAAEAGRAGFIALRGTNKEIRVVEKALFEANR